MVSCWLLVVSCQWSVVSCWLLVVSCQWSVVSCQLLVVIQKNHLFLFPYFP
ncbi:MAG: hypothetical protein ACKPJ4_07150 [Dolichospermum sp.]